MGLWSGEFPMPWEWRDRKQRRRERPRAKLPPMIGINMPG